MSWSRFFFRFYLGFSFIFSGSGFFMTGVTGFRVVVVKRAFHQFQLRKRLLFTSREAQGNDSNHKKTEKFHRATKN